ncbi:hypothetical protein Tco_0976372 [Tanacetum coccineum]|uniref:Uncharacterized protein n=1 Tax=Tanacetum coccineum TaxID=301880 RepID=A0ABQ5EH21_9ASTR
MAKSLASHISSKGRSRQLVQSRLGIQYVFSLNVGKKLYTFIRENERSILLRKMSHRLENFGNILNEPSVETSMTEKTPNTLYDGGMSIWLRFAFELFYIYTTSESNTVATDSTVKKSRNITRKLYEQVSKTCSWWYPKYTPSGYKWKPKSQKGNVNPNVSMPLGNASRTANILEHKTPRCSTVSNTPLSSNSFAARRDNSIHRRLWVLKAHDRKSQASN